MFSINKLFQTIPTMKTPSDEEVKTPPIQNVAVSVPEYPTLEEEVKLLRDEVVLLNKRIESLQKSLIEQAGKEKVVYIKCDHCKDEELLPK
jgi:hypothetical protein